MSEIRSEYLKAQVPIAEPLQAVQKKPFYITQNEEFKAYAQTPVSQHWSEFIHSVKLTDDTFPSEIIPNATYTWTQEGKTIKIKLNDSLKFNLDNPEEIRITETSITSPHIRGDFLFPILTSEIKENEIILIINEYPNTANSNDPIDKWPVLITGGEDPDPYSLYLLSELSKISEKAEFYYFWLIQAAEHGFELSQKSFAMNLLSGRKFEQAMYWFTRYAISTRDEFSQVVIAQYLFEAKDENTDPVLAENILINLVKEGAKDPLYYLGYLHLQKMENWNNDEKLAVKYLQESCEQNNDCLSMQLLADCYKSGLGCERDFKKGIYYEQLATKTALKEKVEEVKNEVTEKKEKIEEKSDIPLASFIASAVAVAGVAACGLYVFRRIFRK
ncbi:hypothetical protein TRFO_34122 [Tritrichomonas foetus]|uniref:Sel1 repeat family protein n=1 Tax=Tritrichomonas foetus TaxID=1144522 RepID=A0A1J4JPG1_9EUKA|nr:hypothetical protein TRFO_34122 [Tritrichomonas foetus]|eukprot:OHS99403.1 hypothetical protein TRFO_34122 [Tritrichomonas foetus]